VGLRVGVAYSCNKLALHTKLSNLNLKSQRDMARSTRLVMLSGWNFPKSLIFLQVVYKSEPAASDIYIL